MNLIIINANSNLRCSISWARAGALALSFLCAFACSARADITTGLVGRWTLDESPASNGTTISDASGSGLNGTLMTDSGATDKSVAGQLGKALYFDYTDYNYVLVPRNAALEPASVTLAAWVKGTPPGNFRYIAGKLNNPGQTSSYSLSTGDSGQIRFYIAIDGTSVEVSSTIDAAWAFDDTWHHLVGTYDRSFIRIYLDGDEVLPAVAESAAINYNNPTVQDFYIGAHNTNSTYMFLGAIDEVRVYSRALSAADVLELYQYTGAAVAARTVLRGAVIRGFQISTP